jgi:hypothetical protein
MDAIEILGGLLGGGKNSGGLGGQILTEILKGGARRPAPPPSAPPNLGGRASPRVSQPIDLQREASELEELLNVAQDRNQQRRQTPAPQHTPQSAPPTKIPPSNSPFSIPAGRSQNAPAPRLQPTDYRNNPQQQNEDALVLIRAMINAAKSDGEISDAEQQSILERIGNPTQEVIAFLRREFAQPLDVREFAWSVPLGLEQKVYTLSLAAIDLDAKQETTYLRELAHGLRLTPEICNQIHQQFGASEIF